MDYFENFNLPSSRRSAARIEGLKLPAHSNGQRSPDDGDAESVALSLRVLLRTLARRAEGLRYCVSGVPSIDTQLDYMLTEAREAGALARELLAQVRAMDDALRKLEEDGPEEQTSASEASSSDDETLRSFHATVLVVDDDTQVLEVTSKTLQWLGYAVLSADGGREALSLLNAHEGSVDLALLDLMMPEMNGIEVFPLLRDLRPKMRIIISSGFSEESFPESLRDEGYGGFLMKPYGPVELTRALETALQSGGGLLTQSNTE